MPLPAAVVEQTSTRLGPAIAVALLTALEVGFTFTTAVATAPDARAVFLLASLPPLQASLLSAGL